MDVSLTVFEILMHKARNGLFSPLFPSIYPLFDASAVG